MRTSQLGKNDGDGYESWVSTKKKKRKSMTAKDIVKDDDSFERGVDGALLPLSKGLRRGSTGNSKGKRNQITEMSRTESGQSTKSKGQGTVVITEKEYRLLLALKSNSKIPTASECDDRQEIMGTVSSNFQV